MGRLFVCEIRIEDTIQFTFNLGVLTVENPIIF